MRVGAYIDGFNLYYGGRNLCGRGTTGWRWLDVGLLVRTLIVRSRWADAEISRVVYCSARIRSTGNSTAQRDQDVYLKALVEHASTDHIEYGTYVERLKRAPLAVADAKGRPQLVGSEWPLQVQTQDGEDVPHAKFMVSVSMREEKGSDVNVATHLLHDVLTGEVDAAIVISNDSDLKLPVQMSRRKVPVCTVNPTRSPVAGDLRGDPASGAGQHWWYRLTANDFREHQMPIHVGKYRRPDGW